MTNHPIMKCGCAAQGFCSSKGGKVFDPPIPSCVVHDCLEVADTVPVLAGRMAKCAYSGCKTNPKPSSPELAFFEFMGKGSREATEMCVCGYHLIAHQKKLVKCKQFIAKGPQEFDKFYCGCRGWD